MSSFFGGKSSTTTDVEGECKEIEEVDVETVTEKNGLAEEDAKKQTSSGPATEDMSLILLEQVRDPKLSKLCFFK